MLSGALIRTLCTYWNPVLSSMEAHIPAFWLSAESLLSWSSVLSRCCPLRLFPLIITGPPLLLLRIPVNLTSVLRRLSHWRRRFFFFFYTIGWTCCTTSKTDYVQYAKGVTSGLWILCQPFSQIGCFVSSILAAMYKTIIWCPHAGNCSIFWCKIMI